MTGRNKGGTKAERQTSVGDVLGQTRNQISRCKIYVWTGKPCEPMQLQKFAPPQRVGVMFLRKAQPVLKSHPKEGKTV